MTRSRLTERNRSRRRFVHLFWTAQVAMSHRLACAIAWAWFNEAGQVPSLAVCRAGATVLRGETTPCEWAEREPLISCDKAIQADSDM